MAQNYFTLFHSVTPEIVPRFLYINKFPMEVLKFDILEYIWVWISRMRYCIQ